MAKTGRAFTGIVAGDFPRVPLPGRPKERDVRVDNARAAAGKARLMASALEDAAVQLERVATGGVPGGSAIAVQLLQSARAEMTEIHRLMGW
jgi:hypothetical protein